MNTLYSANTNAPDNPFSLHQLVNQLLNQALPSARSMNSQIVNEIRVGIAVEPSMKKAIGLIRELIDTVLINSRDGDIHIMAERIRGQVILTIQERNNNNGYALAFSIGTMAPDAVRAGGYLSMTGQQKKLTTITFTFPGHNKAA